MSPLPDSDFRKRRASPPSDAATHRMAGKTSPSSLRRGGSSGGGGGGGGNSLAGLISKLLPGNRPEKGGTIRDHGYWEQAAVGDTQPAHVSDQPRGGSPSDLEPDRISPSQWNMPVPIPQGKLRRRPGLGVSSSSRPSMEISDGQRAGTGPIGNSARDTLLAAVDAPSAGQPSDDTVIIQGAQAGTEKAAPEDPRTQRLSGERAHELFEAKRTARLLRRSLKESGDYLGVYGINPRTGEMDVLTPTTTSPEESDTSPLSSYLEGLAQKVRDARQAYKEAKNAREADARAEHLRKEEEKLARLEREKEELRAMLRQARWRKEEGRWSSVAEPGLSPIAQSQSSNTVSTDSTTVRHDPLPEPFLGDWQSSTGQCHTIERLRRRSSSSSSSSSSNARSPEPPASTLRMEEALIVKGECRVALGSLTNQTHPPPTTGSSRRLSSDADIKTVTAISSQSKPRLIPSRRRPPVIPNRSGPGLQDTGLVSDGTFNTNHALEKLIDVPTLPRLRRALGIVTRIPSGRLLENRAETWADGVMQDIAKLGRENNNSTGSGKIGDSQSQSPIESASILTITTTGCDRSRNGSPRRDVFDETNVAYGGNRAIRTSAAGELLSSASGLSSTPSWVPPRQPCIDLSASRPSMRQSVWPSLTDRVPSSAGGETGHLVDILKEPTASPQPPPAAQRSATTSARPSTSTRDCYEGSPTRASAEAGAVSVDGPSGTREARTTMRAMTSSIVATPATPAAATTTSITTTTASNSTLRTSTCTSPPSRAAAAATAAIRKMPSLNLDQLAAEAEEKLQNGAMAQGAARLAFVQHASNPKIVDVTRAGSGPGPDRAHLAAKGEERRLYARAVTLRPAVAVANKSNDSREQGEKKEKPVMQSSEGHSRTAWEQQEQPRMSCVQGTAKATLMLGIKFIREYWRVVRPAFEPDSELRTRFIQRQSTWSDCAIYLLAMLFSLLVVAVGVWSVRGVLAVARLLRTVVKGFAVIVGF